MNAENPVARTSRGVSGVRVLLLVLGVLTACTAPTASKVRGTVASVSADGSTTLTVPRGPTVLLPTKAA